MPKYRITQPCFIAPVLITQAHIDRVGGVQINYDGVPSITWEPLDEEAEAAIAKVFEEKPHAAIAPFGQLRTTGGDPGEVEPAPTLSFEPQEAVTQDALNLGSLAMPGKAKPGLSDGGEATKLA